MRSLPAQAGLSRERLGIAVLVGALLAPAVAVGARAFGAPGWLALILTVLNICVVPPVARRLPRALDGLARSFPRLAIVWVVVATAAVVQTGRLAVFMDAPSRTVYSVLPWDTFWRTHSCFSAYFIAADRVRAGDSDVYAMSGAVTSRYESVLAPLDVDDFLYPPTFLVPPRLGLAFSDDAFVLRRAWFAIEVVLLGLALGLVARSIGGREGLRAGLMAPAVWAATPVLLTLQIGNVQLATFAAGMIAFAALSGGHRATCGALIAFLTTGKIFPGILGIVLLVRRQWHAVAWTVGISVVIAAAALLITGPASFRAFAANVPTMSHGDLFFPESLDSADRTRLAAGNFSVFGLVMKLRQLGVSHLGPNVADAIVSVYTLLLLMLLWRASVGPRSTLCLAQVWLAALVLAAARSPFVPSAYGAIGALWLFTLVAAEGGSWQRWLTLSAGFLMLVYVVPDRHQGFPTPATRLLIGLLQQLVVFALGFFVLVRAARTQMDPRRSVG